jgi:hypothetical protein
MGEGEGKGEIVPVLKWVPRHEDGFCEWRYSSTFFNLRGKYGVDVNYRLIVGLFRNISTVEAT